ncbi:retrotransposon protein, putative, ty1-copia subclass [Tanacetum coccineum]
MDIFHDNKDARVIPLDNEICNMDIKNLSMNDYFQAIKSKSDRLANLDELRIVISIDDKLLLPKQATPPAPNAGLDASCTMEPEIQRKQETLHANDTAKEIKSSVCPASQTGASILQTTRDFHALLGRGQSFSSDIIPSSPQTLRAPQIACVLYIDAEEHELGDLGEPANYKAALLDPESDKWLNAMNVEMQSMKDNEVWILVELPPNGKTVGSKWLFKQKYHMDGAVLTYKARLVAKGYTQTPGIVLWKHSHLLADH